MTCVLLLSAVKAAPIQSNSIYFPDAGFVLTESLSEYYENIVDQVMLDVSETVLSFIPQSISHGDVEVRQLAQKSLNRNLNFMRASLLASVNPLVSTDIPQIAGFTTVQNEANLIKLTALETEHDQQMEGLLFDSITTLNKKISHQLGLIVNAEQSSSILMRQATTQRNTQKQENPTVITVEWKLRQPFQFNLIREQVESVNTDLIVQSEWLLEQLSLVEQSLFNEFNDRAQEAVQLVLESLALDI
ncbi:hypothetical protein EDC94DRAFT_524676 [Helicostylum pulchrum]|uniref:Uncharacterized protein n=1 Tax=Helicostylum pulchrum TaxID=562976 RepID=A0ABP9YHJ2_9FUNG|nr:hypothetical protein EDC94DRAFT_524676 [Helicostylum pulchrum]